MSNSIFLYVFNYKRPLFLLRSYISQICNKNKKGKNISILTGVSFFFIKMLRIRYFFIKKYIKPVLFKQIVLRLYLKIKIVLLFFFKLKQFFKYEMNTFFLLKRAAYKPSSFYIQNFLPSKLFIRNTCSKLTNIQINANNLILFRYMTF